MLFSQRSPGRPRTLSFLTAVAIALGGATLAFGATDPDGDPATPIPLNLETSAADVQLTAGEAFVQQTEEGLPYLRIDYTVLNVSSETVVSHGWQVNVGEAQAVSATGALLEPGEEMTFSALVFGKSVENLDPDADEVTLIALSSQTTTSSNRSCLFISTQSECEARVPAHNALCNGKCIARGHTAGMAVCQRSCFKDDSGQYCCDYTLWCECWGGLDFGLTLTEGLFEGLVDPVDPLVQPGVEEEIEIEVRPWN